MSCWILCCGFVVCFKKHGSVSCDVIKYRYFYACNEDSNPNFRGRFMSPAVSVWMLLTECYFCYDDYDSCI